MTTTIIPVPVAVSIPELTTIGVSLSSLSDSLSNNNNSAIDTTVTALTSTITAASAQSERVDIDYTNRFLGSLTDEEIVEFSNRLEQKENLFIENQSQVIEEKPKEYKKI